MSTSSRTRSSGPILPTRSGFKRSVSPSGRFCSSSPSDPPSGFASSTAGFSSPASSFFHRSCSPTRVNLCGSSPPPSPSVRFSVHHHRSISPSSGHPISVSNHLIRKPSSGGTDGRRVPKKACMCSPTTHPGSFRCSLHKNGFNGHGLVYSSNRLNARRSAMTNSLVRIGTVEGEWVKRALTALIRPSSHQQRRRTSFQRRPSRLSVMSRAEDP